jgi:FdhD protein
VAVAISYQGSTQAVLMASPDALEELAIGFTLTESIVPHPNAILSTEIIQLPLGFEVRVEIEATYLDNLTRRRRFMAGPVGCGLCGIDSLDQAVRPLPDIDNIDFAITAEQIAEGLHAMGAGQHLNKLTRAVHAAAFYAPKSGFSLVCEDVGRHNALDKLIGRVSRDPQAKINEGAVFVSSRLSVEMVQKMAHLGCSVLVAVSAPTSLALQVAQDIGLTLVAVARGEDFEVFTHPQRIMF